jgi:hypothetical protein
VSEPISSDTLRVTRSNVLDSDSNGCSANIGSVSVDRDRDAAAAFTVGRIATRQGREARTASANTAITTTNAR